MSAVSTLDVSAFVADLHERGTGDATVRPAFRLIRAVFNKALLANLIGRNPTTGLKVPAAPTREMHFATAGEVARLAGAVPERYAALVHLLSYGGLRIGEACALQVSDLDLLRGRVTVSKAATEVGGHLAVGPTKTGATRTVALPAFLRTMLAHHIELGFTASDGSGVLRSRRRRAPPRELQATGARTRRAGCGASGRVPHPRSAPYLRRDAHRSRSGAEGNRLPARALLPCRHHDGVRTCAPESR